MKTHLKNGLLSDYGFSCGYIQKEIIGSNKKELYKEHGVYHVKNIDKDGVKCWTTYDSLKDARSRYNAIILPLNS